MSDKCEPPEELRGVDGWHWLVWTPNGETEPYNPTAIWWDSEAQNWCPDIPNTGAPRVLANYRYLCPVLTPAEADALRKKYEDDMHAAIVEVGKWAQVAGNRDAELTTLRARVAVLEEALKPFAEEADGFDAGAGFVISPLQLRAARAALSTGSET